MAIIWQTERNDVTYQVRQAGNSLRLYTDQVLHSQYNTKTGLTGSVWDLLCLPVLAHPSFNASSADSSISSPNNSTKSMRVLLLGVGGGAVMNMLEQFFNVEKITGVELNPVHIEIARDVFGVQGQTFELVEADALQYVKDYGSDPKVEAEKFDIIIDDLFFEEDGEPIKVAAPDATWFYQLYSLLKPKGLIIMNFVGQQAAFGSAPLHHTHVHSLLTHALHFTTPFYDNHVLAFSSEDISHKMLKQNLKQHPELSKKSKQLRFNCTSPIE